MNPDDLSEAAFWDRAVCLECEATFEFFEAPEERCPFCSSPEAYPAKFLQKVIAWGQE